MALTAVNKCIHTFVYFDTGNRLSSRNQLRLTYKQFCILLPSQINLDEIHLIFCFRRVSTTRSFCGILYICIKQWWYTRFYAMLQRRTTVTAPELYNNLHRIRTIFNLLQRKAWWSNLSGRLWTNQWFHWTVWSYRKRYFFQGKFYQ